MFYDFIRDNYQIIIPCVAAVVTLFGAFFKKHPVKVVDSLKGQYISIILHAIRAAEKTDLKGRDKLNYAVNFVWNAIKDNFQGITLSDAKDTLVKAIEEILETPQKK